MNSVKKLICLNDYIFNALKGSSIQLRCGSFKASPFVCDLEPQIKYEESQNPDEWKYVERLLPPTVVPSPKVLEKYHSGWKPQSPSSLLNNYFVKRTKNHMMPVYLGQTFRGLRKITTVKYIEGDIWAMQKEMRNFLQPLSKSQIRMQVNEFVGRIQIHGDYVNAVKHFLERKQF